MSFLDELLTGDGAGAEAGAVNAIVVDDVPTPATGIKLFHEPNTLELYYKHSSGRISPVTPSNTVDVRSCVPIGEILTVDNFEFAINAAVEKAGSLPRSGAVLVPPGDWPMTAELLLPGFGYTKPGVRLQGSGCDVTRLVWPNSYAGHCIHIDGYQGDPEGFATKAYWHGGVFDLTVFTANDYGRGNGIVLRQTLWTQIARVNVRGFGYTGNTGIGNGTGIWYHYGAAAGEGNHQHPSIFDVSCGGCTTGIRTNQIFPGNWFKLELNQNRFCDWLIEGTCAVQMDGGMFQSGGAGEPELNPYYGNPFYAIRTFGAAVRSGTGATAAAASGGYVTVSDLLSCTTSDIGKHLVLGGGASKECGAFLITGCPSATSLQIRKTNGAGAAGMTWAVHQNDGNNNIKVEGVSYHEGVMAGFLLQRQGSFGLDQYHFDGLTPNNMGASYGSPLIVPALLDVEGMHDLSVRRIYSYAPLLWLRARRCKRIVYEVPETPETHPDKWDLDVFSRHVLTVVGRSSITCGDSYRTLEEIIRPKAIESFDAGVRCVVASDGTVTTLTGMKDSVANPGTNHPYFIPSHPRLGGRPAIAIRAAGNRSLQGTFATPAPIGSALSMLVVAHIPAGTGAGGPSRGPVAYASSAPGNAIGFMCLDEHAATDIQGYWRNPVGGGYWRFSIPIDASRRIVMAVNRMLVPDTEANNVFVHDQRYGNYAGGAADSLPFTAALVNTFQFCGLAADLSAANDLDIAHVTWLHTPLTIPETETVLRMCQERWGRDCVPFLTTVLTPVAAAGQVVTVDLSSANQVVALPAGHKRGDGLEVQVISAASGHTCTIDPAGSETINGASTLVLSADYDGAELLSDGTNWIRRKR